MTLASWIDHQVPDFGGIVHRSGTAFKLVEGRLVPAEFPEQGGPLHVAVLATRDLFGGRYRVKCGEALNHGSIGVIVLEAAESEEAIWSFASGESNPFDQIEVKGGYVLVLSTSGAVFRFRAELEEVALLIP